MKFQNLTIENFGSIGAVTLPLAKQGLVLITGVNKDAAKSDSNGSAKSMLLEALCWCLWGTTIRGLAADDVVHRIVKKDCRVSVTFEEEGTSYEVIRYRKHSTSTKPNDLELFVDGTPASGNSVAATQTKIEEILGLDFSTFCAVMVGADAKVAKMTDASVKLLLEKLLQTEVLPKALELARERKTRLSLVIQDLLGQKQGITRELVSINGSLAQLQQSKDFYGADLRNRRDKLLIRIKRVYEQQELLEQEITDTHARIARKEQLKEEWNKAAKHVTDLRHAATTMGGDHFTVESALESKALCLAQELSRLQVKKDRITKTTGNTCPTCDQLLSVDTGTSIAQDLDNRSIELEVQLDAFQEETKNTKRINEALIEHKYQEVKAASFVADGILASMSAISITPITFLESSKEMFLNELHHAVTELESLTGQKSPYDNLIEVECNKAFTLAANLARIMSTLKRHQLIMDQLQFWCEAFAPSGIRSFMLEAVTPVLNDRAKYYSKLLTDGELDVTFSTKTALKNKTVKEQFNIQVAERNGAPSYVGASTGERARADLIIALAIGDLASMRSKKQISFRFLDEPFESVDEAGTSAIVNLLNDQRSKYDTIFVVTHNDLFKQLFDNRITVVKENGFSRLSDE